MTYSELSTLLSEVVAALTTTTTYLYSPDDQINTYQGDFPLVVGLPWSTEISASTGDYTPFQYVHYEIQLAFLQQSSATNHSHDTNNTDKLASVAEEWTKAREFIYRLRFNTFSISTENATIVSHKIDPLHVYVSNHAAIGVLLTFKYQVVDFTDWCAYD